MQKFESPLSKAWIRLKKNKLAIISLWLIVLAVILAIIAPLVAPDPSPDADDQILEMGNESPGFKKEFLYVRKNRNEKKSNLIKRIFVGRENSYKMIPINDYRFDGSNLIISAYRGSAYPAEEQVYPIVDVIYPLSIRQKEISVEGSRVSYYDFNEVKHTVDLEEMKTALLDDNIVKKTYRLGSDKYGRDILSRLLFGLRVSISVGVIAVLISLTIGILLGATAGYYRNDKLKKSLWEILAMILSIVLTFFLVLNTLSVVGVRLRILMFPFLLYALYSLLGFAAEKLSDSFNSRKFSVPVDDIIMFFINTIWSIPTILLAMALSFALGNIMAKFWVIYIAVGLSMWVEVARIVRGQVLSVREMEYVQAARGLGFADFRIIFKHILPNIVGPIMVIIAANFAAAILIEAGLSFLGIGVQPPTPSWGIMLSEYRNYLHVPGKAFLALTPGIAIMILVLAFNLLGNGLRDAFDVKGKLSS